MRLKSKLLKRVYLHYKNKKNPSANNAKLGSFIIGKTTLGK